MSFAVGLPFPLGVDESVEGSGGWVDLYQDRTALPAYSTPSSGLLADSRPIVTLPPRIGQYKQVGPEAAVPDPVPLDTARFFMSADTSGRLPMLQENSSTWGGEHLTTSEVDRRTSLVYPSDAYNVGGILWREFTGEGNALNNCDAMTEYHSATCFYRDGEADGIQSVEPQAGIAGIASQSSVLGGDGYEDVCDVSNFDEFERSDDMDSDLTACTSIHSEEGESAGSAGLDGEGDALSSSKTSGASSVNTAYKADESIEPVDAGRTGGERDSAVSPADLERRERLLRLVPATRQWKTDLATRLGFVPLDYEELTEHQFKSQYMQSLQRYAMALMDRLESIDETPSRMKRVKGVYSMTALSVRTMLHAKEREAMELEETVRDMELEFKALREQIIEQYGEDDTTE
ncbi:hypothetical protein CVT26_003814 [Gymnopilus dilepis]|uniref:Uncharacterized protein n=1 Tax=Gymnopilus dilepis TaxID=231916 RepID=A0A409YNK2_9AGAR|nr:hypothetical protein CVT26_003814 [Gymnopilus dilepis]